MDVATVYAGIHELWRESDKLPGIAAALACFVAWRTWRTQHTHNRMAVVPFPTLRFGLGKTGIVIVLANDGIGPMRVKTLRFIRDDGQSFDSIAPVMPYRSLNIAIATSLDGRAISPGKDVQILNVAYDPSPENQLHLDIRQQLSRCDLVLEYTDVYGGKFKKYNRHGKWFIENA